MGSRGPRITTHVKEMICYKRCYFGVSKVVSFPVSVGLLPEISQSRFMLDIYIKFDINIKYKARMGLLQLLLFWRGSSCEC